MKPGSTQFLLFSHMPTLFLQEQCAFIQANHQRHLAADAGEGWPNAA
jgi:hypothetical protein